MLHYQLCYDPIFVIDISRRSGLSLHFSQYFYWSPVKGDCSNLPVTSASTSLWDFRIAATLMSLTECFYAPAFGCCAAANFPLTLSGQRRVSYNKISKIKLEPKDGNDPASQLYQSRIIPLYYMGTKLVLSRGLEPPRPCERQPLKLLRLPNYATIAN